MAIGLFKILVPLAYLVTTFFYAQLFFSSEESQFENRAKLGLSFALILQLLFLVVLGFSLKRCPLSTVGEGLLFTAWILGAIHYLSEWHAETRRLGLFTLLPTTLCVIAAVFLLKPTFALPPEFRSSLLVFHIVASLASYACFSMASILASLYLLLHSRLKKKNFDIAFRKLPPLDKLDKLSANWSFLGSSTMVVSSIIGIWWVRKDGLTGMSPEEMIIYLILLTFLGTGVSRRLFGIRGRTHALLILMGFTVLILTNLLGAHGFEH